MIDHWKLFNNKTKRSAATADIDEDILYDEQEAVSLRETGAVSTKPSDRIPSRM
jgi:hypothetical protein